MRILLIEDEKRMAQALCEILRQEKYEVDHFANGLDGLVAIESEIYDIIILDVMLPGMNGFEIAKRARREGVKTSILMLTAKAELDDKVEGLDSGADDYMTKPFSMLELVSRIRALLRRTSKPKEPEEITVGNLSINPEKHLVTANGKNVVLTYKEYHLLLLLMQNKGVVFSREKLLNKIWGYEFDGENRTVDVHIRTLRTKLGECGDMIETIRGFGYKIGE